MDTSSFRERVRETNRVTIHVLKRASAAACPIWREGLSEILSAGDAIEAALAQERMGREARQAIVWELDEGEKEVAEIWARGRTG